MSDEPMPAAVICPACGYNNEAPTPITPGTRPKNGDVSICINCSQIQVFDDADNGRRPPTEAERTRFEDSPEGRVVLQMLHIWRTTGRRVQ